MCLCWEEGGCGTLHEICTRCLFMSGPSLLITGFEVLMMLVDTALHKSSRAVLEREVGAMVDVLDFIDTCLFIAIVLHLAAIRHHLSHQAAILVFPLVLFFVDVVLWLSVGKGDDLLGLWVCIGLLYLVWFGCVVRVCNHLLTKRDTDKYDLASCNRQRYTDLVRADSMSPQVTTAVPVSPMAGGGGGGLARTARIGEDGECDDEPGAGGGGSSDI